MSVTMGTLLTATSILSVVYSLYLAQVAATAIADQECAFWKGSFFYDGHCYSIMNRSMTWDEAKAQCAKGSPSRRLAEFQTEQAMKEVVHQAILMENGKFNSHSSIWIGGKYNLELETPQWSSTKSEIALPLDLWLNEEQLPPNGKECLGLSGPFRQLSFQTCDTETISICEEYVGNACPMVNGTMSRYLDGTCFYISEIKRSRPEAKKFCKAYNLFLSEPKTTRMLNFIRKKLSGKNQWKIAIPQGASADVDILKNMSMVAIKSCGEVIMDLLFFNTPEPNYVGVLRVHRARDLTVTISQCLKSVETQTTRGCKNLKKLNNVNRISENPCHIEQLFWVHCLTRTYRCEIVVDDNLRYVFKQPTGWTIIFLKASTLTGDTTSTLEVVMSGMNSNTVYLGATDTSKEGEFVWETSGEKVTLPKADWNWGEPSGKEGENYLVIQSVSRLLSDYKVDLTKRGFSCQMDLKLHSHIIVVPADEMTHQLDVTSDSLQIVLIRGKLLDRSGSQLPLDDLTTRVSLEQPLTIDVGNLVSRHETVTKDHFILLESTKEVTVMLHSLHHSKYLFSQLFPRSDNVSPQHISAPWKKNTVKTVVIPLEEGKAVVGLNRDQAGLEPILKRFEANPYLKSELNSAMSARANQDVVVLTTAQYEGSVSATVYTYIPLFWLSTNYITYPSMPLDPNSVKSIPYTAVAMKADTTIKFHTEDQGITTLTLPREGDVKTFKVSSNGFYYVTGNQPFYLSMSMSDSSQNGRSECTSPIIPFNGWYNNFAFNVSTSPSTPSSKVHIMTIYKNKGDTQPLVNGIPLEEKVCPRIQESENFKVCYASIKEGSYNLRISSGNNFLAYMFGTENDKPFCHPLKGEHLDLTTTQDVQPISTATEAIKSTNERTTDFTVSSERMTTEMQRVDVNREPTTQPRHGVANEPTRRTTTELTNQPDDNEAKDMTTPVPTSPRHYGNTCISTQRCQCRPHERNTTLPEEEIKKLRVDGHKVSSYRRKKTSAPDSRKTSMYTGLIGVLLMSGFLMVFILPDVIALLRYLRSLC